ncbi:class Ib ribonucleoside-diphosphate reductase assembly flavoprotein NrdI [Corynebacterium sp. NML120713]|uniref:class Ib ribonucleoside-diphosphate reductase assembly flavoprotein NrdI n=1 Tax=Corynebacterium sp. NML120713 TaxID=1906332 RepID=UPI0008FB9CB2|nr:class Ib ribonucleoside-diphosphate reductase assembly flavoprotein NrdI [Corynebacterium sp. NML120713]OIR43164.1 hypothetical protein BJP06_06180 [Corynebacterium sp. NML120713]
MLLYWSGTGLTRRAVEKYGAVHIHDYVPGTPYTLVIPSYASPRTGGFIPPAVEGFLNAYGEWMEGVVGLGNTTFGPDFCRGAREAAARFGVPVITEIDLTPTLEQDLVMKGLQAKYEKENVDEEVSGA